MNLEALDEKVCQKLDISLGELRFGSRRREVVEARRIVSWIGASELGYSGAELARYLGVTNSRVTRVISSDHELDVEDVTQQ